MANFTTHKNLELPVSPEHYDINVFNKNAMVIDSELNKLDLKNQSQDNLLATKEYLNFEILRATTKENEISSNLASEISRAKSAENKNANNLSNEIIRAITTEENINNSLQNHIADESNPHNVNKTHIGLENVDNTSDMDKPVSIAQQNALDLALFNHNISESAHSNIRLLISELTTRLNTLADSDDTTLDQLSEIIAYIKNNKNLIDNITTNKVNISDIVDDLNSTAADKPLSANQGAIIKSLITDLIVIIGNKVDKESGKGLSEQDFTTAEKNKLSNISSGANVNVQSDWNVVDITSDAFIKNKPSSMPASDVPAWAKNDTKPVYTKSEIGLGNVENKSSATIRNELTKENIITALGYKPLEDFILINQQVLTFVDKISTIFDSRITADSLADVYFTNDTIKIAEKAEITVESYEGKVELKAANIPEEIIKASIYIRVV